MCASVGITARSRRVKCGRDTEVVYGRAVEDGRIIETDGAGHAVAELGGILDVVHAGDGVMTADQGRRVVARITMPRRRIGRGRLTEGESGELDERELDRDITAAGGA